jgi:RNA polymerase sigma factor (sigma-70 family)
MAGQTVVPSPQLPDTELVSRVLKGETSAFEIIIRRYNQRLFRIGMSILSNDTEVEDAMQTAYINAYQHLSQFEQRSSLITWLTRIMLNQCYEQQRRGRLAATIEQDNNFTNMTTPANILANKELSVILEQAIANLPEKYRLVFVLREIEDLSVRETSEALSIEEANVKVRLNRAKVRLRENLNGYMKDKVYQFHLTRCDRIVKAVMDHLYRDHTNKMS